jgi:hypothetical protein
MVGVENNPVRSRRSGRRQRDGAVRHLRSVRLMLSNRLRSAQTGKPWPSAFRSSRRRFRPTGLAVNLTDPSVPLRADAELTNLCPNQDSRRIAASRAESAFRAVPGPGIGSQFVTSADLRQCASIPADMVGHPAAGLVASVAPERVAMCARCQPDLAGERAFVQPGPAQAR